MKNTLTHNLKTSQALELANVCNLTPRCLSHVLGKLIDLFTPISIFDVG